MGRGEANTERVEAWRQNKFPETEMVMFPAKETGNIINVLEQAALNDDIAVFKWATRILTWLWKESETTSSDYEPDNFQFDRALYKQIKNDPPPENIAAAFIKPDQEKITNEEAEKIIESYEIKKAVWDAANEELSKLPPQERDNLQVLYWHSKDELSDLSFADFVLRQRNKVIA